MPLNSFELFTVSQITSVAYYLNNLSKKKYARIYLLKLGENRHAGISLNIITHLSLQKFNLQFLCTPDFQVAWHRKIY